MRIIDQQPGLVTIAQRQESGQVGQVAFHAEYAIGDDDFFQQGWRQAALPIGRHRGAEKFVWRLVTSATSISDA